MRIGLFGGTFDPPHLGHLVLSREAHCDLGLDRLLWLLTPRSPLKGGQRISALHHRLRMVEMTLEGTPFELSRLDVDRPGPHYAVDSVGLLREAEPGAAIIYLMGSDSLNDLPTWQRPRELVASLDEIGVMHRRDEIPDLEALEKVLPGLGARVRLIEAPRVDISSSQVRRLVREGKPFEHLVTAEVAGFIKAHRLYRGRNPQ